MYIFMKTHIYIYIAPDAGIQTQSRARVSLEFEYL